MATPFSYTVPNWKEGSPYAAETAIMTGEAQQDPGMALPLLGILRAQRESNQLDYANELQGQHTFAAQQAEIHAQAQRREDLLKLMAEKNPGSLGLAYNNPLLSPLLAGTDETMMGQHAQYNKQEADAAAYEKAGKGYREFREGGGYTPPGVISNMLAPAGVQIADTTPTAILAAQARGLADAVPRINVGGAPDTLNGGASTGATARPGIGETPEQARQRLLDLVNPRGRTNRPVVPIPQSPVSGVVPPAPAAPGAAQSQQQVGAGPVPAPGQTQAPVVQVPGAPGSRLEVAPSGTPGKPEAQKAGRDALIKLAARDRAGYQSVVSRMTEDNGDVPVALIPGTGWVLVGQDGRYFEIPGFTKSITTDRSGRNVTLR